MLSGWKPGDLVLAPGIMVIAISDGDLPEHALLLIRDRPWDVLLVTDTNIGHDKFQLKKSSVDGDPDFLIFHPRWCKGGEGYETLMGEGE
jgi:hypothetical protein